MKKHSIRNSAGTLTAGAHINHILASSPAVLYSFEARGDYAPTLISENVREVFGYEPSEYLEDRNFVLDRIHPDDAARVGGDLGGDLSRLFKEGYLTNEYRFRRKDGHYCWVNDESRVIYDDAGKRIEVVGSWSDISARKAAEEALSEQTKCLRLLKKSAVAANEASVVEDAMQVCLDEVCALTGWPVGHLYLLAADGSGELVTSKRWHLDNPREFKTFRQVTEETRFAPGIGLPGRVLQSGEPAWISDVTKDPNYPRAKLAKNIGVKAAFCFPVLVGSKVAAVLEFYTPEAVEPNEQLLEVMAQVGTQLGQVIGRKAAEAAVAAAHARLNHILAFSPAVLYSFQATGNNDHTFISENVREVFGYEPSEYLEDLKFVPDRIHPDDAARLGGDLSHLFEEGHLVNEYRFRRKDGSYCWVSDELKVIYDDAGKPVEVVGPTTRYGGF